MALKTCPNCLEQTNVDTLVSAKPYRCVCGKRFILTPTIPDNHDAYSDEVHKIICDAISSQIFKHSVSLVYKKHSGEEEISSGTAIRICNKTLIATTGHSIMKNAPERMWVLPKAGVLDITNRHIKKCFKLDHIKKQPDVGIIELIDGIDRFSGLDPISIDSVIDSTTGDSKRVAFLCGGPSDYVIQDKGMGKIAHMVRVFMPIAPEAWHCTENSFPDTPDVDNHIILYHDQDTIQDERLPSKLPPNPDPHGMSGGGYWQLPPRNIQSNQLWTPDRVELIGIQSSVSKDNEFLKGFQIASWIKLVSQAYPDNAKFLNNKFKRLSLLPNFDFREYP